VKSKAYTDAYTEYEGLLYEWERGATVSFEREEKEDDIVLLREVKYAAEEKVVTVTSDAMSTS